MNIKRAKEEIKNTVQAYLMKDAQGDYVIPAVRQRPIFLIGAPGIGKTQIMEQIARESQIGLVAYTITHHTRQSAVGLPFIREESFGGKQYSITEYTMSEIIASVYRKIEESGLAEGILFIDEINCVSETLAPTMLQFLQCKTFGNQAIPEGWLIVAAGNPPEYNKSVREFDMVTLDRVRCLRVEPDLSVWKQYAKSQHINSAILSYLELRPQNFYRIEADVDGMKFVTARGWEDLSNLMDAYHKLGLSVDEEIIYEFLQHEDVAKDVAAYFDLYQKYQDDYGIPDILAGRVRAEVYARLLGAAFDERLSVVNLLLSGLNVSFYRVSEEKKLTDAWFAFLKEFRQRMNMVPDVAKLYETMREEQHKRMEERRKKGFVTRQEERLNQRLQEGLAASVPDYQERERECSGTAFLEQAKLGFTQQREKLETLEDVTKSQVENAFTFMEQAFENGQEMVVFVTELTMGTESSVFLLDNPVERYQEYNRKLLVGTQKAEILSMLNRPEQ